MLPRQGPPTMERESVSLRLLVAKMERLRNAIFALPGHLTIQLLFDRKLDEILAELEAKNGGKPFPVRERELGKSRKKRPEEISETRRKKQRDKKNEPGS